jgi:hypothetical protein
MNILLRNLHGYQYALIETDCAVITDTQTALDSLAQARAQMGCDRMAIPREAFDEAFFKLRTGLLGEVLQKFVNYQMRLAIYGDFSREKSQPLRDFMLESNRGRQAFFAPDEDKAGEWLCSF